MSKAKTYAASILFIGITLLKLIVPSLAEDIRRAIIPSLDYDTDYRAVMSGIGEMLTGENGAVSVLSRLYKRLSPNSDPDTDTAESAETLDGFRITALEDASGELRGHLPPGVRTPTDQQVENEPVGTDGIDAGVDPAPETEIITEPETKTATPEAKDQAELMAAAFLESQAAYADVPIPVNVDITVHELPFDYGEPVTGYNSSGFGFRTHPIGGELRFHYGADYAVTSGTDIYAFASGYVLIADVDESYGNYVVIGHSDGYSTLYAHCGQVYVESGQQVERGDLIALAGDSGIATGPHLHFELRQNGVYLNPEYYV